MHPLRKRAKPIVALLVAAMINLSLPQQVARAAMVPTESVIEQSVDIGVQRERLRKILRRDEARAELEALGVDPDEAVARIDSLSDQEVAMIAGQLDELPAGAATDMLTVVLLLAYGALVFIVYVGVGLMIWAIVR